MAIMSDCFITYIYISQWFVFCFRITPAWAVVILHLSLIILRVFYTIIRCIYSTLLYSTPPDSDFATNILLIPCSVQL